MTESTHYFDSLAALPEDELPEPVAVARTHYVRAVFIDGEKDRAELIQRQAVEEVTYYRLKSPADLPLHDHQARYGAVPYRVRVVRQEGGERVCDEYSFGGDGHLLGRSRERLTDGDNILSEDRYAPDGTHLGRTEYLYDDEGDLVGARETTRDGRVIEHDLA